LATRARKSKPQGKTAAELVKESSEDFPQRRLLRDRGRRLFVRGIIHLPIVGTAETLRWGVWGSLSRENFEKLMNLNDDFARADLPPMFSWLSNWISEYPDTRSIKMYAHIQEARPRPHFELQLTDHPLSQECHKGISPERVKELRLGRLGEK
jgi:hypothetical protein